MEEAVRERLKVFVFAHRSDEKRQAYLPIFGMPHLSLPKPWLRHVRRLALLSPKCGPKSVYSCLCSIAGSTSSFSSPNFSNSFFPGETGLVFADFLRSHFSVSQQKALLSRARGYFSELCQALFFKDCPFSFMPHPGDYFFLALPT